MNSTQAKKIDFPKLLSSLGFEPVKVVKNGNELWYNSPFRHEKDASFHTSYLGGKWIWNDFGDTGGTVIDFVMRYQNTDIKGALAFLENRVGGIPSVSTPKKQIPIQTHNPEIFTLKEVKNFGSAGSSHALAEYILKKRCIDRGLAEQYLKEVHFINTQNGKHYFAAGFKNLNGGYEIRNPFFKSTVPEVSKSMSLVRVGEGSNKIACFEGFIDFLSYGTLFGIQKDHDYLILNSVSYQKEAVEMIKGGNYALVKTYFDNDKAGLEATQYFQLGLQHVEPQNSIYPQVQDINAYLTQLKQAEINR